MFLKSSIRDEGGKACKLNERLSNCLVFISILYSLFYFIFLFHLMAWNPASSQFQDNDSTKDQLDTVARNNPRFVRVSKSLFSVFAFYTHTHIKIFVYKYINILPRDFSLFFGLGTGIGAKIHPHPHKNILICTCT